MEQKLMASQSHLLSDLWLPDQVALNTEIENLGQSTVRNPQEKLDPEAARTDGWVSGEEFYMYVQPGTQGCVYIIPWTSFYNL